MVNNPQMSAHAATNAEIKFLEKTIQDFGIFVKHVTAALVCLIDPRCDEIGA